MILNTRIWNETVNAAKAAAITSPAWLRAIERAAIEIERARYWPFADGVLTIQSTTSKKMYRVADSHTCEAKGGICKHRAARRLMMRYTERLLTAPVPAPMKPADDRASLITDIKVTWSRKHPREAMADTLMHRFGVNRLEMLAADNLARIQLFSGWKKVAIEVEAGVVAAGAMIPLTVLKRCRPGEIAEMYGYPPELVEMRLKIFDRWQI